MTQGLQRRMQDPGSGAKSRMYSGSGFVGSGRPLFLPTCPELVTRSAFSAINDDDDDDSL